MKPLILGILVSTMVVNVYAQHKHRTISRTNNNSIDISVQLENSRDSKSNRTDFVEYLINSLNQWGWSLNDNRLKSVENFLTTIESQISDQNNFYILFWKDYDHYSSGSQGRPLQEGTQLIGLGENVADALSNSFFESQITAPVQKGSKRQGSFIEFKKTEKGLQIRNTEVDYDLAYAQARLDYREKLKSRANLLLKEDSVPAKPYSDLLNRIKQNETNLKLKNVYDQVQRWKNEMIESERQIQNSKNKIIEIQKRAAKISNDIATFDLIHSLFNLGVSLYQYDQASLNTKREQRRLKKLQNSIDNQNRNINIQIKIQQNIYNDRRTKIELKLPAT